MKLLKNKRIVDIPIHNKKLQRGLLWRGFWGAYTCIFKKHINEVIETAKKLTSWVLRTFHSRSSLTMITLWKSLVLPKIEYCSQLWNPWQSGDIQNLEMLQYNFIRKIKNHQHQSYWERLKNLKLYSLERRREWYQIIYVWKILENFVPNIGDGIKSNHFPRLGRLCFIKAKITTASASLQTIRHNFLATRGAILFNSIPKSLRNMTNCSVGEFKSKSDSFLLKIPD